MTAADRDRKWVKVWLFAGVVMVFVQILLGGVTRLTGSGLSITRWDIVLGTIPPMNAIAWEEAFDFYKATPQYQKINAGMTLGDFKFIYFWEYFHRLWARTMGFVFLIPFLFFLFRKTLSRSTMIRLVIVVGIAAMAAAFGWIMVASGLVHRPWVDAYKLTIHLGLGISLFIFLFYTWLAERGYTRIEVNSYWRKTIGWLIILAIVQVGFGGFVSGMRSALLYPTWPMMHGEWIPAIVLDGTHWNMDNFLLYDKSGFMPSLVQVVHRYLAYILFCFVLCITYQWIKSQDRRHHWIGYTMLGIIVVQILLGILTLLFSKGEIPVGFGAGHQGVGILFLTLLFYIYFRIKSINI